MVRLIFVVNRSIKSIFFSIEGLLNACTFDFLTDDWKHKSYILYLVGFNFCLPFTIICFLYGNIVKAVGAHERALRAQAKKMNVESLRANTVSFSVTQPL